MARKLSPIAWRISSALVAGLFLLAADVAVAQTEASSTDSPKVVDNPFAKAQAQPKPPAQPKSSSQPQTAAEPPQKTSRRPVTYQNPFAAAAKSPPVDTSLRPGPISRWRRPTIPGENPTAIKSALLASPAGEPDSRAWDQLPPAEDLRSRVAARAKETDPTFFGRLMPAPDSVHFTPTPLTQPNWLTEIDEQASHETIKAPTIDATVFDVPLETAVAANQAAATVVPTPTATPMQRSEQVSRAFAVDGLDIPSTTIEEPTALIPDPLESADGWLEQAQHVAQDAVSLEELSAVIESCDRGLRSRADQKISASLRRLNAWAHNRRGELLADSDRADDALSDFQAAISLDPNCSLAVHNRAVTFAQQNQFAAALRDFNRVIELNPGLAVAYRNRAELLAATGRAEEAISDYNQAIDSLPNDAQLYRDRAYAYQQIGDFAKSAIDFDRSIEINPNDADAITQRGNLAAEQGNFDEAVADFRQAITKDPNWAEAYRSLAWLEATCPNASFQNPQEAIIAAERAAKLAPAADYLLLDTLAAAHASAGRFDKATEIQRQAVSCAPPEMSGQLKQRFELYRMGHAFRNLPNGSDNHEAPGEFPAEANLPVGALR
jgi:tetratricopeptide (TPR) repeat protein